ncbi:MAG: hypothetical protein JXL97_07715 [Bacteroidales bacterium]|nr:hypothetical protein [Bacteroidales bacterium]
MEIKQLAKNIFIVFFFITSFSCNKLFFKKVECRSFEYTEELEWFTGEKNDTVTFIKPDSNTIDFVISDKYLIHRTLYHSGSDCNCKDLWGILMVNETDTISIFSESYYIENNDAEKSDNFYIIAEGHLSGFINEDVTIIQNFTVDSITFNEVKKFEYPHANNSQFHKIYIAKEIGIVQMEKVDGEIWINQNLTNPLATNLESFEYSENTCE